MRREQVWGCEGRRSRGEKVPTRGWGVTEVSCVCGDESPSPGNVKQGGLSPDPQGGQAWPKATGEGDDESWGGGGLLGVGVQF